ncbi:hypothetical protein ED208_10240 [Stagnimonas aquatica]|uniref:Linalool dehydratase/isomerase domain-containing protein n=1 Tax=Stagnimonas aquatica TaxID=2689987 RepID=A0A3N0V9P4_9GAMM|nr:hypothetical protein [Stagnimonas aquatica]ROH89506.1 hypothetical protein ED208_10240 [Stagnimonas aquatica]
MSADGQLSALGFAIAGRPVATIPTSKGLAGPVTLARWRRTALVYLLVLLLGTALAWAGDAALASFGLGLVLPGGGFLMHAGLGAGWLPHLGLLVASLGLFLLSLLLWVATGNLIAPVLVWLGSALAAAVMDHWPSTPWQTILQMCQTPEFTLARLWTETRVWLPTGMLLLIAGGAYSAQRRLPRQRADCARINAYLAEARTTVTRSLRPDNGLPLVQPVSTDDLALWRFLLDRALQPVQDFSGFDRIDEFREAAKRYQICNISYMLSMHAYIRAPAFRGYQAEAQERLSQKMMDHRVWSYWRLENLWGNLRADPNPFARDNIMYYGWYGGMLGLNLCLGNGAHYNQPGAIRLQHPSGREYRSSFGEICQIIRRNMQQSDYCLFPCEPRWIYPICNNFGALSLKCHDRRYGSHYWEEMRERYQRSLEDEFVGLDGRITAIRDHYTGMTIPALTATMADAVTALFLHPLLPEIAGRSWEIIRHDLIHFDDAGLRLSTRGWDHIDFGNYRRSPLSTYALVAASAREMGDDEVADRLLLRIEEEFPSQVIDGVRHYPGASVSSHAVIHAARILRGNGFHDLVEVGMPAAWAQGPMLESAPYPQVLVAAAVSDGQALELHLVAGTGPGRYPLELSQLRPGRQYRLRGLGEEQSLMADEQGRARLQVDLPAQAQLLIHPRD